MSIQAGVFMLHNRPVPADAVHALRHGLRGIHADTAGEHLDAGVAMMVRGVHVTPEDADDAQPLVSERGYVMTWDGRLDNRDDIHRELWHLVGSRPTDGQLALAAYEQWASSGLARLVGDWSAVIWDSRTRTLHLASDYLGSRALYYHVANAREVHWSTSLAELVQRLALRDRLDPRFVVGYLTSVVPPNITPYDGIASVPPAHVQMWSVDGVQRCTRFWNFPHDRIRHKRDEDYAAELRGLFADAVRARLRAASSVWCELSGGLDSSTVVCMADHLHAIGAVNAPVETISYVTDGSPESDERTFITTVEQHRGRQGTHIVAEESGDGVDAAWDWVTPLHPSGTALEIFRTVWKRGGRVLMSGNPGDLVMMNFPEDCSSTLEAVRDMRFSLAFQRLHELCRASRRPIWHQLALMLRQHPQSRTLEGVVRDCLRTYAVGPRDLLGGTAEAFHFTDRAAQFWLDEMQRQLTHRHSDTRIDKARLLTGLRDVADSRKLQTPPDGIPIAYTHPYTHRPLVAYVLGAPAGVLCQPGRPRALMKRAFSGLLPERIASRFSKGYVDSFKLRKLKRWIAQDPRCLDDFILVQTSYVDVDKLRASCQAVRSGSTRSIRNLERILRLERWLAGRLGATVPSPSPMNGKEVTRYVREA